MLIDFKNLNNIPVETQSGRQIGRLDGIIIDSDSQNIYQYIVKPAGIKNIFEKELLINKDQVLSVGKDKIIVEDGTYKQTETNQEAIKQKTQLHAEPITYAKNKG